MTLKIVFAVAAVAGLVAIFYVSWFWRALIAPMVILLFADVILSLFKKRDDKK
ncbi:hypothetical protein HY382_02300 [Candidatus Curtissbacteria bacterium]|nr:hypothetical protein [Candidatus Curtissbacteria bacterium]